MVTMVPPAVGHAIVMFPRWASIRRLAVGRPRPDPRDLVVKKGVKIIAASNRNLEKAVSDGTFREDLYYRLAVLPIVLPPLRERLDDLRALVEALVDELAIGMGKRIDAVSRQSIEALAAYHWPGNIRERATP